MKPLVVITTFLGGSGPTGVETHFNQLMHDVGKAGGEARLVTPYTGSRLRRMPFRPLKNITFEPAVLLYLRCQGLMMEQQLRTIFAGAKGRPVTVYAQCPASARVALAARAGGPGRILAVIHYNVSESEEVVNKGIARPDGPWCRQLARVERETLPRLDGIAFVSDFMRRIINERVPGVRNVFQETIFNFAPAPPPEADAVTPARDLVAIGTLEPRKNQSFLLQVLAATRAAGYRYTLTVIGDGPDRRALEALAQELQIVDQVRFAGFLRNGSLLIPQHRALVHAARRENSPLIVPEALACGRPVFAAPVGGIPEMVRDGIEGYHWNLEDPAAAARARYDTVFAGLRERWVDFVAPTLRQKAVC